MSIHYDGMKEGGRGAEEKDGSRVERRMVKGVAGVRLKKFWGGKPLTRHIFRNTFF